MANWQHRLDLIDLWKKYDKGEITPEEEGKEVAKRLRKLIPSFPKEFHDEANNIADAFENEVEDVKDFDRVLDSLYDLADTTLPTPSSEWMPRKLMWVATSF